MLRAFLTHEAGRTWGRSPPPRAPNLHQPYAAAPPPISDLGGAACARPALPAGPVYDGGCLWLYQCLAGIHPAAAARPAEHRCQPWRQRHHHHQQQQQQQQHRHQPQQQQQQRSCGEAAAGRKQQWQQCKRRQRRAAGRGAARGCTLPGSVGVPGLLGHQRGVDPLERSVHRWVLESQGGAVWGPGGGRARAAACLGGGGRLGVSGGGGGAGDAPR